MPLIRVAKAALVVGLAGAGALGWPAKLGAQSLTSGSLRGIVQATLEKHPLVESFDDAPESHLGATLAILKP